MQDKLCTMLGEPGILSNIGNKYFQVSKNIWHNTALTKEINVKSDVMENTDLLFSEQIQKMKFYAHAKQTKLVDLETAKDGEQFVNQ